MRLHRPVMLKLERWQRSVFSKADFSTHAAVKGHAYFFVPNFLPGQHKNRRSVETKKRGEPSMDSGSRGPGRPDRPFDDIGYLRCSRGMAQTDG